MSGTVFILCFVAALIADSAPVLAVLALVGIAGLVALLWGVAGYASGKFPNDCEYRHKKTVPGVSSTKDGRAEK